MRTVIAFLVYIGLFLKFVCIGQAEPIRQHPEQSFMIEIFDTKKQVIIHQLAITPYIKEEAIKIIDNLKAYGKIKIDFDGVLIKIPLSPVLMVDSCITSEPIIEMILYLTNKEGHDLPSQLVLLITQSNKTIICTSAYNFEEFMRRIVPKSAEKDATAAFSRKVTQELINAI